MSSGLATIGNGFVLRSHRFFAVCGFSLAATLGAHAGQSDGVEQDATSDDASLPIHSFVLASENDDADAMFRLGFAYEHGTNGLDQDDAKAVEWYQKGAALGHVGSMDGLGFMNENGFGGLDVSGIKAIEWYKKAIEAGYINSHYDLGNIYRFGAEGVPQDGDLAETWYRKGAELGHASSIASLGLMIEKGMGSFSSSDAEAVDW